MKYFPRLEVYKNYNGNNLFNPSTLEARSYQWWIYVAKINGKLVFNDYRYSTTTQKHQSQMSGLLSKLGIKLDLVIEAPQGLQDLNSAIKLYEHKIAKLELEIAKPRSQKAKNIQRSEMIQYYFQKIAQVKSLITDESIV